MDILTIERRRRERRRTVVASAHYVCHLCPFEGDEQAMIDHALDCGHVCLVEVQRNDGTTVLLPMQG